MGASGVVEIETRSRAEIIDITGEVEEFVRGKDGDVAVIYTTHTTTAVIINEAESGLMRDVVTTLSKLIPERAGYEHDRIDSNADAHLRAALLGNSVVIPIENGRLALGTWQRILFVELDGPRRRRVIVKIV